MLQTILTSSRISVQGMFVRALENGQIVIRVGDKLFQGEPVKPYSKSSEPVTAEISAH